MPNTDIPIGNGQVIPWIAVDGRPAVTIDLLIPRADWFWPALQAWCVPDCCGINAFDLTPERIRWAAGDDVEPPAEFDWRAAERGDPGALAAQLETTVAAVLDLGAAVVRSSREFNEDFDTIVFVAMMRHIASVLRQPHGRTVTTTGP